ncbi:hypothetical protein TNCV_1350451 [Trichonephila clavipes]|nr:hypothetical protein TNCV_1350451 [Trichonephila clavipes]
MATSGSSFPPTSLGHEEKVEDTSGTHKQQFDSGLLRHTRCRTCCSALVAACTQHGFPERKCQAIARRTLNSLTGFYIFPWPAISPNLNPVEHLWDLIGRNMNRGPLAQTVEDVHTSVDVAWQRLLQAIINGQIDRMPGEWHIRY